MWFQSVCGKEALLKEATLAEVLSFVAKFVVFVPGGESLITAIVNTIACHHL